MRILIIDKHPRARQNLKSLLNTWFQYRSIREATNVSEALHLMEEFQPQSFLADVRIPEKRGLEAIRSIKAKNQSIKTIVISMNPGLEAEALKAGTDAFVSKNASPQELREALEDVLRDTK
jgi:two-component system, NarL family, nitrate/nitrite response regulator NarL